MDARASAPDHLHEVTGSPAEGANYLALVASIEGDRERVPPPRDLLAAIPSGTESCGVIRTAAARDLCYLGRYAEAEVGSPRFVRSPGPALRAMGSSVEALTLAARGRLVEAEASARTGIAATDEMTILGSRRGPRGPRDRARARRKDRRSARRLGARSGSGTEGLPTLRGPSGRRSTPRAYRTQR